MEYDRAKQDYKGLETAITMRNDFQELTLKIKDNGDNYIPNKADIAKLLVGSFIMVKQLEDQIQNRKKALKGYQEDLIPKLQKILTDAKNDDEIKEMVEHSFIIDNNN